MSEKPAAGQTVFVQSAATRLSFHDEVVLFDCFGGGAYRSPLDVRHRPERGLMHIVNELACRGLCDPILPGASDPAEVVRRSIQRFSQAIDVLRRTRPTARLIVIIDAADNAAMEARDRGQSSFPQMLLESLSHTPSIDGLLCIATARTERRELAIGRSDCNDFPLGAFSPAESKSFIEQRRPEATSAQIEAIHRRSNGNPRVISNLIEPDRPLAEVDIIKVDLNDLIRQRIERAIRLADDKGATRGEVSAFLCALSVLPPPVPIDEIATAFGISVSEVESFASDLSPLLERTRHGLIFRDEPTETLVRQIYGQQLSLLDSVVSRLTDAQASSTYAARSLPSLLFAMGRTDLLRSLAFDTRYPPELDSDLAKRAIRLNRLRTAVGAAAKDRDFSATVDLLVELASLVIVDERGEDYVLEHPDLVVGLGDPEALRRLFEARTGWPGTRHSRLAIAYVADGDTAEAFGHAVRADNWHQWHHDQDEETRRKGGPSHADYASIAFYLFAQGRTKNLAKYITLWKPVFGYSIAKRLFEHCTATDAFGKLPKIADTLREVVGLSSAPPALISAAFTAYPGFASRSVTKVLLRRLATKVKALEDLSEDYGERDRDTYRRSLIRCATRMAHLGMTKESARTLTTVAPDRFGIWLLRDAWHSHRLVTFALSVATRCASEARIPDLFDCIPKELWALVEDAPRPLTDKAQRKLLDERLEELRKRKEETTTEIEERRKRSTLSSSELYHSHDKITGGVMPLLGLVRQLTDIIVATKPAQVDSAISAFFSAWKAALTTAGNVGAYISQEQRQFTDALYKGCAVEIFASLDLWKPSVAEQLSPCLEASQSLSPEMVVNFVRQLAARPACHDQAGQMAVKAVRLIEREDDVQRRAKLFASLSRALITANLTEAALIFKRGLRELDAIGSGDYDFAHELLGFAATLRDAPLASPLALRLAKICEINVYDSHKWPWPLTARAFARTSGATFLSQIARWHDRDKVDLNLTLPSAITYLVKDGTLHPDIAVPLLWLVDPQPMWGWGWHDLIQALLSQRASLSAIQDVIDQYDHSFPGRSSSHYLHELRKALESDTKIAGKLADRIELFEQRSLQPRKVELENHSSIKTIGSHKAPRKRDAKYQTVVKKALADVNPLDSVSLESFFEKVEKFRGRPDDRTETYKKMRERVTYGDRAKHVEAIVGARNIELFEKNDLLQSVKDDWSENSPTQLAYLSGVGLKLVRQHAEELLDKKWGFGSDLFKLSNVTGTPAEELAIALVEAATTRELNPAAMTWLSIATILSKRADAAIPRLALERLLDSGAARLADEIGDGPWREELDPGTDSDEIAARLLWFGLGSPLVKDRWRATHSVRAMARFGQWTVIERLFVLLDASDAGAFQDRSLPFFRLHAQLWFLIAVARIALDFPGQIARFHSRLEAIAFNDAFPHVGLREAACEALRHCVAGKRDSASRKLLARITGVNTSRFSQAKTRGKSERDFPWERTKEFPQPEPRFYFDYDYEKAQLDDLAKVFGLPKWRIGDLCQKRIHEWAPDVTSMNDFSGRHRPYSQRGYYRPTEKGYHSHGTYLTWHALAVLSGELLLERPITDDSYYDDPWQEWLSDYRITRSDGYWVADGTGRSPIEALNDLRIGTGAEDVRDMPTNDKSFLATLAGLSGTGNLCAEILVQASWSSPDGVDLSVMSALVDPAKADLAALAVATSPPFHMWLPFSEPYDEDEQRHRGEEMTPCERWITHVQQSENLDERDPFGSPSAMSIYRPAKPVITKFGLIAKEPWSHSWIENGSTVFRYEAWGGWEGDGDSENRDDGKALYCDRTFLKKLLIDLDKSLIVLIKLRRFHERKRYGGEEEEDSKFTHSFLVATVDKEINVTFVEPSKAQTKAVSKLSQYSIHDFAERWRVLEASARRRIRQRR